RPRPGGPGRRPGGTRPLPTPRGRGGGGGARAFARSGGTGAPRAAGRPAAALVPWSRPSPWSDGMHISAGEDRFVLDGKNLVRAVRRRGATAGVAGDPEEGACSAV